MIPDIHAIVEMLLAGECTAQQAIGWINTHMENADLRDHFAGCVLQGLLACDIECGPTSVPTIAASCYVMADEMLKARSA